MTTTRIASKGACFNPRAPRGARPSASQWSPMARMFQSTRPARGATFRRVSTRIHASVSIHAPRAGRDGAESAAKRSRSRFQSTRPARGATFASRCCGPGGAVSIHAPRAGRDEIAKKAAQYLMVSIHAPRAGRDAAGHLDSTTVGFQSTRPVRGATAGRPGDLVGSGVSIHAPRAGRDGWVDDEVLPTTVSIHAPRAGRDVPGAACRTHAAVSIHAPRAGRDPACRSLTYLSRCFNPRAPRGARRSLARAVSRAACFNPRAPRGARQSR